MCAFNHIKDKDMRDTLSLTYQAVTNTNSWDFLRRFEPDNGSGFMFSSHIQLDNISRECERLGCGHSGASWAISMRHMDAIAKKGWDNYVSNK